MFRKAERESLEESSSPVPDHWHRPVADEMSAEKETVSAVTARSDGIQDIGDRLSPLAVARGSGDLGQLEKQEEVEGKDGSDGLPDLDLETEEESQEAGSQVEVSALGVPPAIGEMTAGMAGPGLALPGIEGGLKESPLEGLEGTGVDG